MATPTTVFSLRLPNELKRKCEELASESNLSLNEWIKRILASIASPSADENYQTLMSDIDEYVSRPNITNNSTRIDFIKHACNLLLDSDTCPDCGELIPPHANFCPGCGTDVRWADKDLGYAHAYYYEYIKTHPLPKGWQYTFIVPSKEMPDYGYHIAKFSESRGIYDSMRVVKTLSDDDLEEGMKLLSGKPSYYVVSSYSDNARDLKKDLERVKNELDSEAEKERK